MSAVIDVQHLHKRYGDRVAIEDFSFTVAEGEIFGLLGATGAGKTTVLECLVGLRGRDGGAIEVLGHDPRRERAEITRRLGRELRDTRSLDQTRVARALTLYGSFYRDPGAWRLLMEALGITGTCPAQPRQRLSAVLAAVGRPQVAVFDDLTGPDAADRQQTWDMVRSVRDSGTTVVLGTSSPHEAELLCDRYALLEHGRTAVTH
ncbi:ATP-binding cassette domain-containing protein [Krasilnikovia sp. MM14-A1259]|uniref:ATP-binding cassette domain-containing protein n=1 Tax=Krasilnikovia sp. MM14-A1259 TaxID=3373539 RepID=UPI00380F576D